jgi:uncharacterized protein YciW
MTIQPTRSDITFEIGKFADNATVVALRNEKPQIFQQIQDYYNATVDPDEPGSVSLAERALIAQRVAELIPSQILDDWYGALLESRGGVSDLDSERIKAILKRVALVNAHPDASTPEDVIALQDAGLGEHEIIAISQLIAFVHYQARLLVGLHALGAAS